jgi:hypothetical protein
MHKLTTTQIIFNIFLCITFLLGLYFTLYFDYIEPTNVENLETIKADIDSCPDLLIKKGNVLLLYDTNIPTSDTNPIPFYNLDEYINYLEVQKQNGKNCPVLFVQEENNTQGQDVYKIRPSPFHLQGGLPSETNQTDSIEPVQHVDSNRTSSTYNKDTYPGFDPYSQEIGVFTDLDVVHDSTGSKRISDNPMDSNWAGNTYTQQMIDSGKYVENEITRPKLFEPKTVFFPSIKSAGVPPRDFL